MNADARSRRFGHGATVPRGVGEAEARRAAKQRRRLQQCPTRQFCHAAGEYSKVTATWRKQICPGRRRLLTPPDG